MKKPTETDGATEGRLHPLVRHSLRFAVALIFLAVFFSACIKWPIIIIGLLIAVCAALILNALWELTR